MKAALIKKKAGGAINRLFKPAVLRRREVSGRGRARERLPENGEPVVYCARQVKAPEEAFRRIEAVWGSEFTSLFPRGVKVLIKINLNSSASYPASTSPEMARALVDFLNGRGVSDITVGDCSGNYSLPTRRTASKTGISRALKGRVKFSFFDVEPWVEVTLGNTLLGRVTVPRSALEAERIISLANLKTHCLADFSFGIKSSVGFMHPLERRPLHREHLREKVAELPLAVGADLTIIDGRTAFITGGPDRGETARGDAVIFGANPLAVDAEAYRMLYALKKNNSCLEGFREDPFEMPQLRRALEVGVGGDSWRGYSLKEI